MENKSHALAAGAFVLALAGLLVALALWLTRESGTTRLYEMSTPDSVTGLQPQAPVRYKGVAVGKVSYIGFDPEVPGNVVIRVLVDETTPLTPSTFASLSYQGITGLAFVQLDESGGEAFPTKQGNNGVPRLPLKESKLGELTNQAPEILAKVQDVLDNFNKLLGPENLQQLNAALGNAAQATGEIAGAARNVNQLTAHLDSTLRQRLDPALAGLPGLTREAGESLRAVREAAADVSRLSEEYQATARRLNEKDGPLDRLAEGTVALSRAADTFAAATLPRVNRVTDDASRAARQLSRTVNNINDNPQSLIFGSGVVLPGPGEPGFTAPGAVR